MKIGIGILVVDRILGTFIFYLFMCGYRNGLGT